MNSKILELLEMYDLKGEWKKRREIMLSEKIDVVRFMSDLLFNYTGRRNLSNISFQGDYHVD